MSATAERLFAVIRTRGAGWNASQPLEGQSDWSGHATFMNALATACGRWTSWAIGERQPAARSAPTVTGTPVMT